MRDLFSKYIIEDGKLAIGRVTFHKEIAWDVTDVKGGGWYDLDNANKVLLLYSTSDQFGQAQFGDVQKAVIDGNVGTSMREDRFKDYEVRYSTDTSLDMARANFVIVNKDGGVEAPIKTEADGHIH